MSSLFQHVKVDKMKDGWYVVYGDGRVLTEHDVSGWTKIPDKKEIVRMGLKWRHKRSEIIGKRSYIAPGGKGFKDIKLNLANRTMVTGKAQVAERFIGYYSTKGKVKTVVNAKTGKWSNRLELY